jgi:hypothetical protein
MCTVFLHFLSILLPFLSITAYICAKFQIMADIRLSVDKDFIEKLKMDTGLDKASQLTSEALTFYKGAVSEAKEGRLLLSTDGNGENMKKIVFPALERARERGKE